MTLSTFLTHQWLNFWRGRNANKSLFLQIIVGFFYFIIFLYIATLGIALPFFIEEIVPGKAPIAIFTSYIIYYFLIGFILRFQMQELPSLSIQPYLTQNIKRKAMLQFLNMRSLIHIINFLPLFVFIPFTIVIIVPEYGIISAMCFLIAMLALVINNHFITMYIKRRSVDNSWFMVAILLLLMVLKALDYFKILSFETASTNLFVFLLQHPFMCIFPFALSIYTFLLNNSYLRNHLYIEELVNARKLAISNRYDFLHKYGNAGSLIALELKLIFRNKRPRSMMILSGIMLFYGLMFYPTYLKTDNVSALFLFALLITGVFIFNYGTFLFAWQSSHFDIIVSSKISLKEYIKSKFTLFIIVSFLQFLLASFYGFLSWKILPIQLAAFLFNIGVNSFITIYAATYNYKYVNISRSATMNYQGLGAVQWLQSLLISLAPMGIFFLLNKFFGFVAAIITICLIGILGLIFHETLINWLVNQFNNRKYKIMEGFRER